LNSEPGASPTGGIFFSQGVSMSNTFRTFTQLCLTLTPLLAAPPTAADETAQRFAIPSQPLADALLQFSEESGVKLFFSSKIAKNLKTSGINGNFTPTQALDRLLAESGLHYRYTQANAVTIEPKPAVTRKAIGSGGEATLPPVSVSGAAEYDAADPYNPGYQRLRSRSATKTDTLLMETPFSVQVVPRAVMDDQKSTWVKDALENVSGVRAQPSLGGGSGFIIRGFRTGNIFRNGLLSNEGFFGDFDAGNLDSIEVLKGPAQLYGRTEPGGLIAINTKRGLDSPYYSLEQQFGSYDYYRTQWDAGGPVTGDKKLLYRFSGAYQNNNSFRDFVSLDRKLFNPSVTWRPTDATDVTIDVEGTEKIVPADFGIPVIGKRPAPIPISRNLGDPNTPLGYQSSVKVGSEINHRFSEDWAIHNRFLASLSDGETTFVNPAPAFDAAAALDQATGLLQRNIFRQFSEHATYATNLDITGKFDLGFSRHQVLVGFDFYRQHTKYGTNGQWVASDPSLAINIYNPYPSYGIPQSAFDAVFRTTSQPGRNYSVIYNGWYGVYFQDQITLWDKLHIIGGGRHDWAETGRGRSDNFKTAGYLVDPDTRKDQGFSPKVGILYEPWKELSVYGSWTTSFGANNAPAADGRTFAPQIAEQFEAGIKTQLFDRRLIGTLAYYYLTKDNILVNDLSTDDPFDKIANKQRSQGIELDVSGYLTDKLSVIGSYAFTDARILEDHSGGTAGNRLTNVPEHAGSLWLKYALNGTDAPEGFSFGVGGVLAGQREGDFQNSFQMPGYVRMDAFVAYKRHVGPTRLTAQFNIRNLLDKEYYESTDPDSNVAPALGVYPGAPLTAIGSLRLEY
jgi:iron complex outermembrane receptor protein